MIYYNSHKKVALIWEDVQKSKIKSFYDLKDLVLNATPEISDRPELILAKPIPKEQCALLIKVQMTCFSEERTS